MITTLPTFEAARKPKDHRLPVSWRAAEREAGRLENPTRIRDLLAILMRRIEARR